MTLSRTKPITAATAIPDEPTGHHTVAFPVRLVEGGADLRFFIAGDPLTQEPDSD